MADSRISGLYLTLNLCALPNYNLGAVTLYLGRGALARARWLRKTIFPEKAEKECETYRFHHENLKVRKNTGTLLLCVEDSVHMRL